MNKLSPESERMNNAFARSGNDARFSPPDPPKRSVGFQLKVVTNLIKRYSDNSRVKQYAEKLTGAHNWVIGYLYDNRDHAIFQRDLEQKFNIRRSSVSSMLSTMEKNGLIVRVPVEYDARLKKLELTEKALELHQLVSNDIDALESMLTDGISDEELSAFLNTLAKIKHNIEDNER